MSDETQLRFDLGTCDAVDDALQKIVARENVCRRLTETATSDAMRSVREARRRRLVRHKVRLALSDQDAGAFLFDGRRTFQRDQYLDWRLRERKGAAWIDYPVVGFRDVDLGDPGCHAVR